MFGSLLSNSSMTLLLVSITGYKTIQGSSSQLPALEEKDLFSQLLLLAALFHKLVSALLVSDVSKKEGWNGGRKERGKIYFPLYNLQLLLDREVFDAVMKSDSGNAQGG